MSLHRRVLALERKRPPELNEWRLDMLRYIQARLGLRGETPSPRALTDAERSANAWTENLSGLLDSVEAHRRLRGG